VQRHLKAKTAEKYNIKMIWHIIKINMAYERRN
jgi:hypothetical protein